MQAFRGNTISGLPGDCFFQAPNIRILKELKTISMEGRFSWEIQSMTPHGLSGIHMKAGRKREREKYALRTKESKRVESNVCKPVCPVFLRAKR